MEGLMHEEDQVYVVPHHGGSRRLDTDDDNLRTWLNLGKPTTGKHQRATMSKQSDEKSPVFTLAEAAAMLKLSERTVERRIRQKKLKKVSKPGDKILISRASIDQMLAADHEHDDD
jgi:excisionase family DNA binding protein